MLKELFKIVGTVAINNKDANKALDETSGKGKSTAKTLIEKFQGIGKVVANVGEKVIKIGAKASIATATAIAGIATASTKTYANLEQNIGGVETLFKDSANTVIENVNNAYKTAGMSANEYMETVTSFSASLLKGLNGDTAKSAKIADMAIVDMSDNANKMRNFDGINSKCISTDLQNRTIQC